MHKKTCLFNNKQGLDKIMRDENELAERTDFNDHNNSSFGNCISLKIK